MLLITGEIQADHYSREVCEVCRIPDVLSVRGCRRRVKLKIRHQRHPAGRCRHPGPGLFPKNITCPPAYILNLRGPDGCSMADISGTDLVKKGILLRVKTSSGVADVMFEFAELIDMQVNALHLLQFPGKYQCDPDTRRIWRKSGKYRPVYVENPFPLPF